MRYSYLYALAAFISTVVGYPAPVSRHSLLSEAQRMGEMIQYLKRGPPVIASIETPSVVGPPPEDEDPTHGPKNYSMDDPIEQDIDVNCYHFAKGRDGAPVSYRKCFLKHEKCNQEWRTDIRDFRANCVGSIPKNSEAPVCSLLWEPDIEAPSYCYGKEVKMDNEGNRVPECGPPTGIGDNSNCPGPKVVPNYCPIKEECEKIEPDPKQKKCKGVWSACERNFVKICSGTPMPCQKKCEDAKTCVRYYPVGQANEVVKSVKMMDWDMVGKYGKGGNATDTVNDAVADDGAVADSMEAVDGVVIEDDAATEESEGEVSEEAVVEEELLESQEEQ